MDGYRNEWMNGLIDTYRWMNEWMDEWIDTYRWMNEWMVNGWMD